jgi:hypothetical protein
MNILCKSLQGILLYGYLSVKKKIPAGHCPGENAYTEAGLSRKNCGACHQHLKHGFGTTA